METTVKLETSVTETGEIKYGLKRYELLGFTQHMGTTGDNGHYRAFLRENCLVFDDLGGSEEDPDIGPFEYEDYLEAEEQGYMYLYKKIPQRSSVPNSTSSQATEEGHLEHDQEQLKAEGDRGTGVSRGMTFLAAAPPSCSTASSPAPLNKENNFNPVVVDPVFTTPVKRKQTSTASSTPTSVNGQSSGTPTKQQKILLPSPGKRDLQAQSQELPVSQRETIEEMAEMVALGEVCHGPVKVCL